MSREFTRGVARGIDRDVGSDVALMRSGIRRFGPQLVDIASIVTNMYARDLEPGIIDVKVISSVIAMATVSDASLSFDESTLADAQFCVLLSTRTIPDCIASIACRYSNEMTTKLSLAATTAVRSTETCLQIFFSCP